MQTPSPEATPQRVQPTTAALPLRVLVPADCSTRAVKHPLHDLAEIAAAQHIESPPASPLPMVESNPTPSRNVLSPIPPTNSQAQTSEDSEVAAAYSPIKPTANPLPQPQSSPGASTPRTSPCTATPEQSPRLTPVFNVADDESDTERHRRVSFRLKTDEEMAYYEKRPVLTEPPKRKLKRMEYVAFKDPSKDTGLPDPAQFGIVIARCRIEPPAQEKAKKVAKRPRSESHEKSATKKRKTTRTSSRTPSRTPSQSPYQRRGGASSSRQMEVEPAQQLTQGRSSRRLPARRAATVNAPTTRAAAAASTHSPVASVRPEKRRKKTSVDGFYVRHEVKKGWVMCKICEEPVWPPNKVKHLVTCNALRCEDCSRTVWPDLKACCDDMKAVVEKSKSLRRTGN